MEKARKISIALISITSLAATVVALNLGISIALYSKSVNGNGTYGEVALRSYYDSGSGTEDDPFIITRPRHLYNLSRLHGLGLYGPGEGKTYFQLGKEVSPDVYMCYEDDTSNVQVPYLNMIGSNRNNNPINAIGSEALPFYGEFNGNDLEIKNLNVYANPEDAGLFGYTAHGSSVHNLFLSDVTIHALGYTSDYATLYDPGSTIGDDVYFVYDPNDETATTNFDSGYQNTIFTYFYANNLSDFEYTAQGSSVVPTVTIHHPSLQDYSFSYLLSGDLITSDENNELSPDLDRLFSFFKDKKDPELNPNPKFPIQASSSVALVVSSVDRYGQKHSKVILSLEYDFTLESATSNFISMGVRIGTNHGNNIGLIAGHCDGTISDCYVCNGSFEMNDGGAGYYSLPNGSNLGLIGLVGGTVQNIVASEADVGAKEGKNIGVLDFTTIYDDIIGNDSFNSSVAYSGFPDDGVTYVPKSTTKYENYLRKNNSTYVTLEEESVSFRGQTIVTNTDLGVFTVATDAMTDGTGSDAGVNLKNSLIRTEDLAVLDAQDHENYYIYYATGEYSKTYSNYYGDSSFNSYQSSYNSDNPSQIAVGHHFPRRDHLSRDAFNVREARHNYFVRFKLDPTYRRGKGFYFSDLDVDTDGGAYLANYFNYKLVDQNSHHIPINDNKCGVMLKNNLRQEIGSFSGSFAAPDLTYSSGGSDATAYVIQDGEGNKYVSNMINFEVKNEKANVTVIAAPVDRTKPSTLGVYKIDNSDISLDPHGTGYQVFNQRYFDPDYAFFMPDDNHLAYFDYRVNELTQKGQIGVYSSNGTFTPATNATNATVAKKYDTTEYGYAEGKTRLFAHTFCLPRGRYCIGSASTREQSVPKIFYMCAQGQDDGQFDFDDTVFASSDKVEDVDFVMVPRFNLDTTENIVIPVSPQSTYNPSSPTDYNLLGNRRLYLALVNSDRSLFDSNIPSNLTFEYDSENSRFVISSTSISALTHIAVDNYNHGLLGDPKHLTVVLINNDPSDEEVIVYPADD